MSFLVRMYDSCVGVNHARHVSQDTLSREMPVLEKVGLITMVPYDTEVATSFATTFYDLDLHLRRNSLTFVLSCVEF